jgi:hypothetical protein
VVRIARVQALITSTISVITEAAATRGHIDDDVMQRLGPALEASQVAWSRAAKRWGELTNPASRTDPALVGAASELRSAIAAAASNQGGWATPDQLATRVNLPSAVRRLHLSIVASIDIAYVLRDTAADHPGLTGPARIIGMRSQGEAEIAIEQGETRYEGITWTTRRQIAANRLIRGRTYCSRFVHLDTTLLPDRSRNGNPDPRLRRNRIRQERNMIMEPLMVTAAEATDMLRVGRSGVYRLIAARHRESIKIGRPERASVGSIPDVAAQSAALCMWRAVWL